MRMGKGEGVFSLDVFLRLRIIPWIWILLDQPLSQGISLEGCRLGRFLLGRFLMGRSRRLPIIDWIDLSWIYVFLLDNFRRLRIIPWTDLSACRSPSG